MFSNFIFLIQACLFQLISCNFWNEVGLDLSVFICLRRNFNQAYVMYVIHVSFFLLNCFACLSVGGFCHQTLDLHFYPLADFVIHEMVILLPMKIFNAHRLVRASTPHFHSHQSNLVSGQKICQHFSLFRVSLLPLSVENFLLVEHLIIFSILSYSKSADWGKWKDYFIVMLNVKKKRWA